MLLLRQMALGTKRVQEQELDEDINTCSQLACLSKKSTPLEKNPEQNYMNLTPQAAADSMMILSEKQSRFSDEYADLEEKRLRHFSQFRAEYKSDKACETVWSATEDGIRHMRLHLELKKVGKELSVIKTFLRHSENIARNLY